MNNIKKYVKENSEQILETVQIGAAVGLIYYAIHAMRGERRALETLGAASFVIKDLGGDPVPLIVAKLIETSGK